MLGPHPAQGYMVLARPNGHYSLRGLQRMVCQHGHRMQCPAMARRLPVAWATRQGRWRGELEGAAGVLPHKVAGWGSHRGGGQRGGGGF
jgi:hypothetical protein